MSSHDSFAASGSSPTKVEVDFEIYSDGPFPSVFLLKPLTVSARCWTEENLSSDRMVFGNSIVVEHRYISTIVRALIREGYQINDYSSRSRRREQEGQ